MSTTEVITGFRSAREVLAQSRSLLDPALRAAVDTLPKSMRRIAGYHFGWWDEHGWATTADAGKAVRPALVMTAAEAVGGSAATAVPAAVAVELVHNFTLLHDDVMDGDRTRRHRPTAWSVFGLGPAILAGDALLTLAYDVLAASEHPRAQEGSRLMSAAVLAVQEGQATDLAFEKRADVDLAECVHMAEGKTGALLGCSTALGALFGGGTPAQVDNLRIYGVRLGLAFQLVDDLLGIWGDPAATGKPVYSDLENRKKSLPVVAALASGTQAARELAALYHRRTPLSPTDLARAADLIDQSGARTWTQTHADDVLAEALDHVRSAGVTPRSTAELDAMAHLIGRRDH
ncbi:geranylgeranyl diphosphate synthase, type I [Actinokineospora alba]|uniref:Geranylgeranyl diphosphate synthase, type I n=1 Tax=Actinokineospora alba TaxID=504798 RepID=A0A1H0H7W2_9PSEU|nr:family 2 encapsulin nanocompartment cargo protein polyprenyl transferase [Actinokineospora alba]TDP65000.1 geranylgeranyl diphosphate synthase type I [Actinokineospora alba]SDH51629.1 geranylgeranyl diphosphate synthase, type I [Actinokineospora alba]SDO15222.1 geranylgeranyl diphosphate synthase, type I [Actinokineospora alba]